MKIRAVAAIVAVLGMAAPAWAQDSALNAGDTAWVLAATCMAKWFLNFQKAATA